MKKTTIDSQFDTPEAIEKMLKTKEDLLKECFTKLKNFADLSETPKVGEEIQIKNEICSLLKAEIQSGKNFEIPPNFDDLINNIVNEEIKFPFEEADWKTEIENLLTACKLKLKTTDDYPIKLTMSPKDLLWEKIDNFNKEKDATKKAEYLESIKNILQVDDINVAILEKLNKTSFDDLINQISAAANDDEKKEKMQDLLEKIGGKNKIKFWEKVTKKRIATVLGLLGLGGLLWNADEIKKYATDAFSPDDTDQQNDLFEKDTRKWSKMDLLNFFRGGILSYKEEKNNRIVFRTRKGSGTFTIDRKKIEFAIGSQTSTFVVETDNGKFLINIKTGGRVNAHEIQNK